MSMDEALYKVCCLTVPGISVSRLSNSQLAVSAQSMTVSAQSMIVSAQSTTVSAQSSGAAPLRTNNSANLPLQIAFHRATAVLR